MITPDRTRAVVQLQAAFGEGALRLNEVFDTFVAHRVALEEVPGLSHRILTNRMLFSCEQADQFQNAASSATRIADRIGHPLLSVHARTDTHWPAQTLCSPAREMMPWLFAIGDTSLLRERAVGIGGSRNATDRSTQITRELVEDLVANNVVIISGGARGVDAVAHRTALEHGGKTVVVLAQGIGTFQVPSHWWSYIDRGQMTVVSEFGPMAGWEGHQALQRNGTVIRLSGAFIVVQAQEMSGTLSAGRNALRLRRPLHVISQTGERAERFDGNQQLIAGGGLPLVAPVDGAVSSSVLTTIIGPVTEVEPSTSQMRLF